MVQLAGKVVLVAGGGGFLGSHICEALLNEGAKVKVLDVVPGQHIKNLEHLESRINIITGSVTDENCVYKAVRGVDAVIDASFPAAGCNRDIDKQHIEVGTAGVFNLLKAAYKEKAYFVFCSSISVYGAQKYTPIDERHPLEPFLIYGATKLAGERYCKIMSEHYGLEGIILRFSDLYGPRNGRNSAPVNFLNKAMQNEPLMITGNGHQVRSYLFISDAAQAIVCALKNFKKGRILNITGPEPLTILELSEAARQVTGSAAPVRFVANSEIDQRTYDIDGSLAEKEIGFKPQVNIFQGLSETLQWLKGRDKN